MIQVQGLSKCYGHTKAVDDLSFEVRPGRVTGFLGPNGSGKSTTMRIVLGLDAPDAGRALVNGRPYRDLPWPLREVGAHLDAKAFHPGRSIHDALGGDPNLLRAKRRHEPESDFLWGEHTIIELDEFQHFSTPRLRSLDFYVGFPVGFSVARYRRSATSTRRGPTSTESPRKPRTSPYRNHARHNELIWTPCAIC